MGWYRLWPHIPWAVGVSSEQNSGSEAPQEPCCCKVEEGGRLGLSGCWSMATEAFTFTFHFHALEKKWQPTPVFLPGESQGRRGLVGCRLWGRTESDMTEVT